MKGGKLRLKGAKRISIKRLRQLARESKRLHTKDAVKDQCDNEDDVDTNNHHGDDQEQGDDQDEEDIDVDISKVARLRKLRKNETETVISG